MAPLMESFQEHVSCFFMGGLIDRYYVLPLSFADDLD